MCHDRETELLKTLESIDGTLKRIEQLISAEKQQEVISGAVSQAMTGEKKDSTPKEDVEYLMKAVQTAIHDTSPKAEKK